MKNAPVEGALLFIVLGLFIAALAMSIGVR
jgi:hypothetical protein